MLGTLGAGQWPNPGRRWRVPAFANAAFPGTTPSPRHRGRTASVVHVWTLIFDKGIDARARFVTILNQFVVRLDPYPSALATCRTCFPGSCCDGGLVSDWFGSG